MAKIFISYKRNVEPDTPVATAVYEALKKEHDVFIDTTIKVGEKWAEEIQEAIKESDYLIVFLSEHSVNSEMVVAEVETAHHHGKETGALKILPVRLNYDENLVYPLSAYLNPLQWALWEKDADTPKLIAELQDAISGGALTSSAPKSEDSITAEELPPPASATIPIRDLGSPEGTMPLESPFYIERQADHDALEALSYSHGATITIKGPRQMGKSSLLTRVMQAESAKKMRNAFIDFQLIEKSAMQSADIFYKQFCSLLSWEFDVEDRVEEFWANPLGHVQKTTNYVQRHLLKEIQDAELLLAMDEVERMFASPFRSDFFSMLRSWHNKRAQNVDWKRLNLALVTSTEPYQLIADLNQSPFNVGLVLDLTDFTPEEVMELNKRHGFPLENSQVNALAELLGGHPFLTRKALHWLAGKKTNFDELISTGSEDDGVFGDHLRNHLFRMSDQEELKKAFLHVIKSHHCPNENLFFRLRGAGLARRVGNEVFPRNELYAEYFGKRLNS